MKLKSKLLMPALLLGALVATSCGDGTQQLGDSLADGQDVTISFYTNIYTDQEVQLMNNIVSAFEDQYPNITVDWSKQGQYYQVHDKLTQLLTTPDRLPNMAVCYPDYVVEYMANPDLVLDMTPYMSNELFGLGHDYNNDGSHEKDTVEDDMNQQFLDEGRKYSTEGTYSLPWYKNSEALFYNYDVLNKYIGENNYNLTNWEDIIDLARKLIKMDDIEVYDSIYNGETGESYFAPSTIQWQKGVVTPIGYDSNDNLYITFSEMMGVPYTGNTDLNGDGRINKSEAILFYDEKTQQADPDAVKMVEMLKGRYDEGLITTTEQLCKVVDNADDGIWNYFQYHQQSLVYINGSKNSQYCSYDSFRGDALPTPAIDHGMIEDGHMNDKNIKSKAMSQGANIVFFDQGDAENQASWLFYKFLTNTQNSAETAVVMNSMPVRSSSYDTATFKGATANLDKFPENAPTFAQEENNPGHYYVESDEEGNSAAEDNTEYLASKVYEIYDEYAANGQTFIAPVSTFSSNARTAVNNLLLNVFSSNATGDQLTSYIKDQFKVAYDNC